MEKNLYRIMFVQYVLGLVKIISDFIMLFFSEMCIRTNKDTTLPLVINCGVEVGVGVIVCVGVVVVVVCVGAVVVVVVVVFPISV